MSIVNKVLAELKIEVKSDIRAANITLIIIPLIPSGIIPKTKELIEELRTTLKITISAGNRTFGQCTMADFGNFCSKSI